MGKSYPYYPAMQAKSQSPFIPEIWTVTVLDAFKTSMKYIRRMLHPQDTWAPTGEPYEEAIAWAKLLDVTIYTSDLPVKTLFLHKPGCLTEDIELCSPQDLIAALHRYVQNAKAPQVDDE
jgi:hypothetical protein